MPSYPSSEHTLRELLAATLDVADNLSTGSPLQTGLEELQDLLIDINANINDGVPMTPADLSALESITATIVGLPSDYPDAGANTKLANILTELQGVLDVAVSNWPADYPDATTHTRLQTVSDTLIDILGEVGDNGTLLAAISAALAGTLTVTVTNPGLTDAQLRASAVSVTDTRTDYPSTAANTKLDTLHTDLGTDTGTPPSSGTGVRGWLRGIYDKVAALPTASPLTDTQLRASSVPVTDTRTDYPSTAANTKLDSVISALGSLPGFITPPGGSNALGWLYGIYNELTLIRIKDDDASQATQTITARDTATTSTTSSTGDVVVTGTPTANSSYSFALTKDQSVRLTVTGTFSGRLVVETSLDGSTYFQSVLYQEDGTRVSLFEGPIQGVIQTSGAGYVRVRATTGLSWSGTATVNLTETIGLAAVNGVDKAQLGTATSLPPSSGVGIIGWLRGIYDKVAALPTTIGLTDTQLRATPVPVSGTVTASGPLTDTQLRASAVPIADGGGSITVDGTVTATGPLTDTQLRATPVPVSGTVTVTDGSGPLTVDGTITTSPPSNASTDITRVGGTAVDTNSGTKSAGTQRMVLATDQPQLTNALKVDGSAVTQPVSGPLTDAQLRATPVPVSGTVTASGGLTDTQLRASAVPVTADTELTTADLDTGAGTDTRAVVGIAGTKSGGAALIPGDATAGLKVDLGTDNDVNVTQLASTAVDVNSGTKSAGTQRVVLATDQPQLTNALKVDGSAVTQPVDAGLRGATGTLSTFSATNTSATVLAGNSTRKQATIVNEGAADLYIKYGSTASSTSYTYALVPGETLTEDVYTGIITGVTGGANATATARVTEVTT